MRKYLIATAIAGASLLTIATPAFAANPSSGVHDLGGGNTLSCGDAAGSCVVRLSSGTKVKVTDQEAKQAVKDSKSSGSSSGKCWDPPKDPQM